MSFFQKVPKLETHSDDTSFYVFRAPSPLQGGPFNSQSQLFKVICNFLSKLPFFYVFWASYLHNFCQSVKIGDSVRGRQGRLEKRKKMQFREKIVNFILKCTLRVQGSSLEGAGRSKTVKTGVSWQSFQNILKENAGFHRELDFGVWSRLVGGGWTLEKRKTTRFSVKGGILSQYIVFSKSSKIGDSLSWRQYSKILISAKVPNFMRKFVLGS